MVQCNQILAILWICDENSFLNRGHWMSFSAPSQRYGGLAVHDCMQLSASLAIDVSSPLPSLGPIFFFVLDLSNLSLEIKVTGTFKNLSVPAAASIIPPREVDRGVHSSRIPQISNRGNLKECQP